MSKNIKMEMIIILLCVDLASANFASAGTSQIYSPAGLPRSGKRYYSTPYSFSSQQTFPVRSNSHVNNAMQRFPLLPFKSEISTKSDKGSSVTVPGQETLKSGNETSKVGNETTSVESLFQCAPLSTSEKTISPKQNKSLFGSLGKVMWHSLDNIGVPMFVSKNADQQQIAPGVLEGIDVPTKNDTKLRY